MHHSMFFNQRCIINLQINTKLALSAMVREINLTYSGWFSLWPCPVTTTWPSVNLCMVWLSWIMTHDASWWSGFSLLDWDPCLFLASMLWSRHHGSLREWHFPPDTIAYTGSLVVSWWLQWWGNPCDRFYNVVGIQCVHPVCLEDSELCRESFYL